MSVIRLLAVAVLLMVASALPSHAQPKHWLVGTWKGAISGVSSSAKYGTERTLTITAVDASGTSANGVYEGPGAKQTVKIAISGDAISFATASSQGAEYKMTHKGDKLEGIWQGKGSAASGQVTLTKQ